MQRVRGGKLFKQVSPCNDFGLSLRIKGMAIPQAAMQECAWTSHQVRKINVLECRSESAGEMVMGSLVRFLAPTECERKKKFQTVEGVLEEAAGSNIPCLWHRECGGMIGKGLVVVLVPFQERVGNVLLLVLVLVRTMSTGSWRGGAMCWPAICVETVAQSPDRERLRQRCCAGPTPCKTQVWCFAGRRTTEHTNDRRGRRDAETRKSPTAWRSSRSS